MKISHTGVRYIGVFFHMFYYYWAAKYCSLYRSLRFIGVPLHLIMLNWVKVFSRYSIFNSSRLELELELDFINWLVPDHLRDKGNHKF